MSDERSRFEAWATARGERNFTRYEPTGEYLVPVLRESWAAWQAALAAPPADEVVAWAVERLTRYSSYDDWTDGQRIAALLAATAKRAEEAERELSVLRASVNASGGT